MLKSNMKNKNHVRITSSRYEPKLASAEGAMQVVAHEGARRKRANEEFQS